MVVIDKDSNGNVQVTEEGVTETLFPNIDDIGGSGGGPSGDIPFASGTYTPSDNVASFSFNVDFEPQYVLVTTDPYDLEQDATWKNYMTLIDRKDGFATSKIAKYNNNTVGDNTGGLNQSSMGTYSNGKFTVNRIGAFNFLRGVTYKWFCWRTT